MRIRIIGCERVFEYEAQEIGALILIWHGCTMIPTQRMRGRPYHAMISNSKDGEIIGSIFKEAGWRLIRGSTNRSGSRALVGAVRAIEKGLIVGITPDGPRGPNREVQPGAAYLAQKTGCPVIPVGVAATPCWHIKSWDQFLIPKPFARSVVVYGEPVQIGSDEQDLEKVANRLRDAINQAEAEAERLLCK
jgi:lysophospholipid acyltransferase (LPLAT)-like uncharacterized protein